MPISLPMVFWLLLALTALGFGLAALAMLLRRHPDPGRVVFLNGPREGEKLDLWPGRVTIGALADNDIVIPAERVSRYHAELRVNRGRVQLWDLQSRNATYLNNENVPTSGIVKSGDTISVAGVEMRYER